jgi:hypothetical protein
VKTWNRFLFSVAASVIFACPIAQSVEAQERVLVLTGAELARVMPPGFYFQGLSAPTQMRNSAAVRFGTKRHVLAGLVDTSGYAADVRAKYEGFLITDSPVTIGGSELGTGAYGFGFSNNRKLNILDLAGNEILSVAAIRDNQLRRPRPLMMVKSGNLVRLYSGKDYAEIAPR